VEPLYQEAETGEPRSFVPPDIDVSVVPASRGAAEATDVTKVELPENMAGLVKDMAEKLNKGLGGEGKGAE
jgi:hypothetical protein